MMLHEINAGRVVTNKNRKRLGRGESSGQGRTSGRGNKGVGQRAGRGAKIGHEGGTTPYWRKMPKRGFSNFAFRKEYRGVNIGTLNELFEADQVVDAAALVAKGLLTKKTGSGLIKILAGGTLTKALVVKAHKFSKAAADAIQAAGGKAEVVEKSTLVASK
jgi:large subunit ribosomal protein L15